MCRHIHAKAMSYFRRYANGRHALAVSRNPNCSLKHLDSPLGFSRATSFCTPQRPQPLPRTQLALRIFRWVCVSRATPINAPSFFLAITRRSALDVYMLLFHPHNSQPRQSMTVRASLPVVRKNIASMNTWIIIGDCRTLCAESRHAPWNRDLTVGHRVPTINRTKARA
jgi:hypothetical protein